MKRKILVLFVLLSLLVTLSVSAVATTPHTLTIAEDLQQVTMDGETYVRANISNLEGYFSKLDVTVELTEGQQAEYERVELYRMPQTPAVIQLDIYKTDDIMLEVSYIREDVFPGYLALLEQTEYTVRFLYPFNNDVITERSQLYGEATTLYKDDLSKARTFEVYAVNEEFMTIYKGWLVSIGENYYYVDMEENGFTQNTFLTGQPKVSAYEVTDQVLIDRFENAMDEYYDGMGIFEDPEVSDNVSAIFMVIMFGFLPLVVLVTFTVFAIITKKRIYRTQYIIVCTCALLVLISVAVIILIV